LTLATRVRTSLICGSKVRSLPDEGPPLLYLMNYPKPFAAVKHVSLFFFRVNYESKTLERLTVKGQKEEEHFLNMMEKIYGLGTYSSKIS
jgi:hypothetical protein